MNEQHSQPLRERWRVRINGFLPFMRENREMLLRFLLIALCLFGMLAGKSDISRVAILSAVMPGIEIRLLCLVALALVAFFWRLEKQAIRLERIGLWPIVAILPWIAMLLYGVIGSRLLWPAGNYGPYFTDFFFIIVYIMTLAIVVHSRKDLVFIAVFLQIFALLIFVISLLRLGPDSRAYNYGEVVTTTTMYRIYGAGFCSALFLLFSSQNWGRKLFEFAMAVAFTFAMLSSTSRTSIIAIVAIIIIIAVFVSIFARWKDLLVLIVVISCGVGVFLGLGSAYMLTDRLVAFGENSFSENAENPTAVTIATLATDIAPGTGCDPVDVARLDDSVALRHNSCIPFVVVPDPSERLRMLGHALELFGQNPRFGVGPLGYNLALGDSGHMFVYTYAHNILADALAKTGIVGLGLLILAIWGLLIVCVRAAGRQFESLYMTCIPLLYLAGSMTGGDLYDTRVGWAIAGAIGGVYGWRTATSKRVG